MLLIKYIGGYLSRLNPEQLYYQNEKTYRVVHWTRSDVEGSLSVLDLEHARTSW